MIGGAYFAAVYVAGVVSVIIVPPTTSLIAVYATQANKTSGIHISPE